MIGITVTGLNETIDKLKQMEKSMPGIIQQTMEQAGNIAKSDAERLCPVATGELLASIYMDVTEDGFELGATAKHAVFNEYGCYNLNCGTPESPEPARQKGFRPFIRVALYNLLHSDTIPNMFSKNWERTLHG